MHSQGHIRSKSAQVHDVTSEILLRTGLYIEVQTAV